MSAVQEVRGHGVFPGQLVQSRGPMLHGWPVEAGTAVVRLRRECPLVCLTLLPVPPGLSPRLAAIVNALPFAPHSRVLEIGCGPGAAARAVATRLVTGHILAIDRSASAIAQARAAAAEPIAAGRLSVRQVAVEELVLEADEDPYDIVFAVRVGALDGRYRQAGERALQRIAKATTPGARLFIDGGDPLRELPIPDASSQALPTRLHRGQRVVQLHPTCPLPTGAGVDSGPSRALARDEQQASGNELQPRALPAQCDRQRGGGAVVVRGEGADRLGHETPVVS